MLHGGDGAIGLARQQGEAGDAQPPPQAGQGRIGGIDGGAGAGLSTCSDGGRQVPDRLPTPCRQGVDRVSDGCRSLWGQHFVAIVGRAEAQHFPHVGLAHAQPEGDQVFQRRRQPLDVGGILATDDEAGICLARPAIERDDGDDEIAAQGGSELAPVAALDVATHDLSVEVSHASSQAMGGSTAHASHDIGDGDVLWLVPTLTDFRLRRARSGNRTSSVLSSQS